MNAPVYLDYAATSAVRPPEVVEAITDYLRDVGATPGRSAHARSLAAARIALRCRLRLAELFGIPGDPGRITFQLNATHALNVALAGLLRPGDAVVRTQLDHNSVRRPVAALHGRGVVARVVPADARGELDLGEVERLLLGPPPARLLTFPHVSNVLGNVLPAAELASRARAVGALVLIDAAQSAGHLPIDVVRDGVDLLAFTGHKGLLGPQGTGGLWVREGIELEPLLHGGTGGDSAAEQMPAAYPDHLEAGTQNGVGIAGLLAGLEWVLERGVDRMHGREMALKKSLRQGLERTPGIRIRSPAAPDGAAIVSVTSDAMPADRLARRLDVEHGVQVRAGLHCAPGAHQAMGTLEEGAVRFSIGWATGEADIDRALAAVRAVQKAAA